MVPLFDEVQQAFPTAFGKRSVVTLCAESEILASLFQREQRLQAQKQVGFPMLRLSLFCVLHRLAPFDYAFASAV